MAFGRKNHQANRFYGTWSREDVRRGAEIDVPAIVWSNGFPLVFFWKDRDQMERDQYERWTR